MPHGCKWFLDRLGTMIVRLPSGLVPLSSLGVKNLEVWLISAAQGQNAGDFATTGLRPFHQYGVTRDAYSAHQS